MIDAADDTWPADALAEVKALRLEVDRLTTALRVAHEAIAEAKRMVDKVVADCAAAKVGGG